MEGIVTHLSDPAPCFLSSARSRIARSYVVSTTDTRFSALKTTRCSQLRSLSVHVIVNKGLIEGSCSEERRVCPRVFVKERAINHQNKRSSSINH